MIAFSNVITRANVANLPPSQDHAGNEPAESCAVNWTAEADVKIRKDFRLGESMKELEASDDQGGNIDPESKQEPCDELLSHIRVSYFL